MSKLTHDELEGFRRRLSPAMSDLQQAIDVARAGAPYISSDISEGLGAAASIIERTLNDLDVELGFASARKFIPENNTTARLNKPRPHFPKRSPKPFSGDVSSYCIQALKGELTKVADCVAGRRTQQLFASSAALASIVAAGGLPDKPTRAALFNAARDCGLVKDDGQHFALSTIHRGFVSGAQKPRSLLGMAK